MKKTALIVFVLTLIFWVIFYYLTPSHPLSVSETVVIVAIVSGVLFFSRLLRRMLLKKGDGEHEE